MTDYPYTLKPSSLEDFLKKISERPEPKKVTQDYLKGLGYTSSNDWAIIPILKFVNFLDSSGVSLDLFKNYRDTRKSGAVMAQALKDSYAKLFELYSNPCTASDSDLENFFRTETGRGGRMLTATVDVFKAMCKFADFGAAPPIQPTPTLPPIPTPTPAPIPAPITTLTPPIQPPFPKEGGITVNVNIRFELPVTRDAEVYDKIFESLKKHLLAPGPKAN